MMAVMKASEVEYQAEKKKREGPGQPRQVGIKTKGAWIDRQM